MSAIPSNGALRSRALRAVVQRVSEASVRVDDRVSGQIGPGLLVLLGVGEKDSEADAEWLAEKVVGLRIFPDGDGKMNRSVMETSREILVVSQFTLYGDAQKGKRPSFTGAKEPVEAERLYRRFVDACRARGAKLAEGVFRAQMKVSLVNDGPVTLLVESPAAESLA